MLVKSSLVVATLTIVAGTCCYNAEAQVAGVTTKLTEEDVLAPVGTSRATLSPEVAPEHLAVGGLLVSIPSNQIQAGSLVHPDYEEFLSRGRFSHTRSIGLGYSGGGGYSIRGGGARAVRSSSSGIKAGSANGFAAISNGPVSLGRSSGNSFATINSSTGSGRLR